jgi:predicted kinase
MGTTADPAKSGSSVSWVAADLHLLAGLNGAGKTTLARQLERTLPAVRFSLDEWMLRLYGLRFDGPDYPEVAHTCRELIWDLAAQVLRTGSAVVLDWNMWSRQRRADAVRRAVELGASCHLHHVIVPIEVAIRRATDRTDPRAHRVDADAVRHLSGLFEEPDESEGFTLHLVRYTPDRPLNDAP